TGGIPVTPSTWSLCVVLALAAPASRDAGAPSDHTAEARAEMRKLEPFVGRWSGEGWIQMGPERRTTAVNEDIHFRQEGLLLTMEGKGHRKDVDGGEVTTHDALGVVFWDPRTRGLRFHAYRMGAFIDSEVKLLDGRSFSWSFPEPRSGGTIRFTARITPEDRWVEVGEHSADGKTWRQFFEMTLNRVSARASP